MDERSSELDLNDIKAIRILGRGALGTVFLAHDTSRDPSACSPFALKVVQTSSPVAKLAAYRRARWELSVLTRLANQAHPFLPTLLGSFETRDLLGWAVPYCDGGDLNALRCHQSDEVFSDEVIKFYLAEILCALEHLHSMGIVYRDLKPENVLIQRSGHVILTDFDLSRELKSRAVNHEPGKAVTPGEYSRRRHSRNISRLIPFAFPMAPEIAWSRKAKSARVSPVSRRRSSFDAGERSNSFVGTEEYVAPEVVLGYGHEFAVDWWALGVIAYEMLYGTTPFKGKSRKETFRNVVVKPPVFFGKRTALMDLIERLLEKDPTRRLGYSHGASEIKRHEFFRGVKWDLLTSVSRPPYLPSREDEDTAAGLGGSGFDVREYFARAALPPSPPTAPSNSPAPEYSSQSMVFSEF